MDRTWEDNPVGFVVVGLGMGANRSRVIQQTPGTKLVGVCDLNEERAKQVSEEHGVSYETDLNKWLDKDEVEAIFVLTETGYHAKIGLQALDAGKHLVVTKPMEASLEACDALIAKAEEKGLLLAVDFQERYSTGTNTLKAAIANGHFGRLLNGNTALKIQRLMTYFHHNNSWRGTRQLDGGGVLSNQAIHIIDHLAFTIGTPVKVRASIWTQNHEIEAEDLGVVTWLYEDGAVITMNATSSYPQNTWYTHLELVGTEGAFFQVSGGPYDNAQTRWYLQDQWQEDPPEIIESPWLNTVDNFAAALRTDAKLVCDGREGRRTQAILDTMYRSAYEADGDWVDVNI